MLPLAWEIGQSRECATSSDASGGLSNSRKPRDKYLTRTVPKSSPAMTHHSAESLGRSLGETKRARLGPRAAALLTLGRARARHGAPSYRLAPSSDRDPLAPIRSPAVAMGNKQSHPPNVCASPVSANPLLPKLSERDVTNLSLSLIHI